MNQTNSEPWRSSGYGCCYPRWCDHWWRQRRCPSDVTIITLVSKQWVESSQLIEIATLHPTSKSQVFSTAADKLSNQPLISNVLSRGTQWQQITRLWTFPIDWYPSIPQIEVTFDTTRTVSYSLKRKILELKRINNCYPIKLRFDRRRNRSHDERCRSKREADKKRVKKKLTSQTKLSLRLERPSKKLGRQRFAQNVTQLKQTWWFKSSRISNLEEMKAKLEALNEKAQALAVKLTNATSTSRLSSRWAGNAGDDVVDEKEKWH